MSTVPEQSCIRKVRKRGNSLAQPVIKRQQHQRPHSAPFASAGREAHGFRGLQGGFLEHAGRLRSLHRTLCRLSLRIHNQAHSHPSFDSAPLRLRRILRTNLPDNGRRSVKLSQRKYAFPAARCSRCPFSGRISAPCSVPGAAISHTPGCRNSTACARGFRRPGRGGDGTREDPLFLCGRGAPALWL